MKRIKRKFIYFFTALILVFFGVFVKYFLVDIDLGARFNNFNKVLLSSDIIFIFALILSLIGIIFYLISRNKKSTLHDSKIINSAILIMPISLVLVMTPFLETFLPDKTNDIVLSALVGLIVIVGVLAFLAWIILLIFTILSQAFIILTGKVK